MNWYRNTLVVASVAIFYTSVPNYVHSTYGIVAPLHWVIGFGILSLPLLIKQIMARSDLLKSPVVVWCFGYAWLTITWFVVSSPQSDWSWQEVRWRALAIIDIVMFLILFANPQTNKVVRQALVVGVLVGVAFSIYELFVPRSFSNVVGRSAGLYGNPNAAGEALVLGMILSVTVLPSKFRAPFLLITGVGVFLTLSRGAILVWLIAFAGLMLIGKVRVKELLLTVSVSLLLVVAILLPRWDQFITTLERDGILNKNVMERIAWLSDPSGVSDDSGWEREYVAKQAWEKVAERPFLGSGTGSSHIAYIPSHNQYLSFMQDHGLIGVAILPLLIVAVTWRAHGESKRIAMIFGFTVLLEGLFSHRVLNEEYMLLLFGVMAAMTLISRESPARGMHALTPAEIGVPRAAVGR